MLDDEESLKTDVAPPARPEPPEPPEQRRLYRVTDEKMLMGVCAGLGRYFEIDPTVFRVAFVAAAVLFGSGVLLYIALALIMPSEEMLDAHPRVAAQSTVDEASREIRAGMDRLTDAVRGLFGRGGQPS